MSRPKCKRYWLDVKNNIVYVVDEAVGCVDDFVENKDVCKVASKGCHVSQICITGLAPSGPFKDFRFREWSENNL